MPQHGAEPSLSGSPSDATRQWSPARISHEQRSTVQKTSTRNLSEPWWWWWCGLCVIRVCLSIRASGMQRIKVDWRHGTKELKMGQHQCANPLTIRKTLCLFPSEGKFQASPVQTSPNPKARKNIAKHANLTSLSFGGRGAQSFSNSSALDAQDPDCYEKKHLDVSSW